MSRRTLWLTLLGLLSLPPYAVALYLDDLRTHTVGFELAFFAAFALYLLAVLVVIHDPRPAPRHLLLVVVGFAVAYRVLLVFSTPTLTDDMYRYVWDGRVQAAGLNPYAFPPDAPEVQPLRDEVIWPFVNRKSVVTIYPAGAQLAFRMLWQLQPGSVHWFQIAMATGDLLAGVLVIWLLRALGEPPQRALIYLWSPLAIFETAHAAHVDGLVLPFLVGAWLATARGRPFLAGALLGVATSGKLYTGVLLPAFWIARPEGSRSWLAAGWKTSAAFLTVLLVAYLPYLSLGIGVIGFLPAYFGERFNPSLARLITDLPRGADGQSEPAATVVLLVTLALIGLVFVLRPAASPREAIRRCIWPIGAFTVLAQILYPWYVIWVVPLAALFLRPGRLGLRLDAWTGWLLFSGLVMLSYTWYIAMTGVGWTFVAQYGPLYLLLIGPGMWKALRAQVGRRPGANARRARYSESTG